MKNTTTSKLSSQIASDASASASASVLFRSMYDNLQQKYSQSSSQRNNEPSKTKQSFKDETDINLILEKYTKTGLLDHQPNSPGQYGDFSEVKDYQTALNTVIYAQECFMKLPAKARSRFANDPGQFLEFIQDPKNLEEAQKLGLVEVTASAVTSPPAPSEKPLSKQKESQKERLDE